MDECKKNIIEEVKLKNFLSLINENMLVDIVYKGMSRGGYSAGEILEKRPELIDAIINKKGIEIRIDELDYILADDSSVRKEDMFEQEKNTGYEYIIIELLSNLS